MLPKENNYAFIDGQNLHLAVQALGWVLDVRRFRIYLREKYGVTKAYWFIGYVEGHSNLYRSLQEKGYILIFKPTFRNASGIVKGNVDAELVLHSMIEYPHYERAVIVSGDGDFACLVSYLREQGKLDQLVCPDRRRYSYLLRSAAGSHISFLNDLRNKLEYKKKNTP